MEKSSLLLFLLLLVPACTQTIPQERAEQIALDIMQSRGQYYNAEGSVSNITFTVEQALQHDKYWDVLVKVEALRGNDIIDNTVLVQVNAHTGAIVSIHAGMP